MLQRILIGFVLLGWTASGSGQEANPELASFAGHWKVVELVEDGKVIPESMIREWLPSGGQIEIAQNAILIKSPADGKKEVRIFSVNATQYPKTIDITTVDKQKTVGIYRFDEGKLIVCLTDPDESPRPSRFAAVEGSKAMLMVLKKAATPQPAPKQPEPVATAKPAPVANLVVTDDQAAKMLIGTWRYVDSVGALLITFSPDGTFYTIREVKELRLFQKTFVRSQVSNGNWKVNNGLIQFTVTGSVHIERVGTASFFRLRSISATDMIFSDPVGLVGSASKIR